MLSHDPAFGFHLIVTLCFCDFGVSSLVFGLGSCKAKDPNQRPYSANHPLASSSLTPMRLLPSMSSIHDPFTSACSLPPNGGTNCTVEPTAKSTSRRSVAPPRLILVAFAFA